VSYIYSAIGSGFAPSTSESALAKMRFNKPETSVMTKGGSTSKEQGGGKGANMKDFLCVKILACRAFSKLVRVKK